jgi:hypothetical protein
MPRSPIPLIALLALPCVALIGCRSQAAPKEPEAIAAPPAAARAATAATAPAARAPLVAAAPVGQARTTSYQRQAPQPPSRPPASLAVGADKRQAPSRAGASPIRARTEAQAGAIDPARVMFYGSMPVGFVAAVGAVVTAFDSRRRKRG